MTSLEQKPTYEPFPMEVLSQEDGNWETYDGHCHCGEVKFQIKISPPFPDHTVISCNCSVCHRNGYLLVYPARQDVSFIRGEDKLQSYEFNRHKATHKFCPACGSSVLIDFKSGEAKDVIGINVSVPFPDP